VKYKLLGKSGLRVSELCLGTMTFGKDWGWGASKDESKKIFDHFIDAGGTFVDTANRYTEGTSEKFTGEFIKSIRSKVVLATKYSLHTTKGDPNDGGNHRKNLVQSLEQSLKRLRTDYVDILYLHAWDFTSGIEEVMRGLEDVVTAGKALYIGISDTPAWIISHAQAIARLRGWHPIIVVQFEYSLLQRTVERDLLPMAEALDIGVTAWAPLAGGALTGKYLENSSDEKRLPESSKRLKGKSIEITKRIIEIARETGCNPSHVAINWLRRKNQSIIPVIGARRVDQLTDNLKCLDHSLTDTHFHELDDLSHIEPGFPHEFLASNSIREIIFGGMYDRIERGSKPII